MENVIKALTSIRGIEPWTSKMYLIFVLNHPDTLPIEDAAFLQAYHWMHNSTESDICIIANKCQKLSLYSSYTA